MLVCLVLAATSVAAYTETTDGVEKTYTWEWQGGLSSVRSEYNSLYPGSPRMIITARMFGTKVTQNGGVETAGKVMYESINASDPDQNRIDIYAEVPSDGLYLEGFERQAVWLTSSTGTDDNFVTTSDFSFTVKLSTLDYFDSLNSTGNTDLYYVNKSRIKLMLNGQEVESLIPTYTSTSSVPTVVQGLNLYDYEITFSLDNQYNSRIEFDTILFEFPCAVNARKPDESQGISYYSRYYVSISDPVLVTVPTEEMLENLIVSNASNDDLIGKLGTVNAADQETISGVDDKSSELDSVIDDYNSSLDSLPDVDTSYMEVPSILEDEAFDSTVIDYWDTFFGEREFVPSSFNLGSFLKSVISVVFWLALISLVITGLPSILRSRG